MLTKLQTEQLRDGAARLGIVLDETAIARFARFAEMLEETNRTLNLTRIPIEEIVPLHFLDSLAMATVLTPCAGDHLIDVGTGAGFPGLPLAIVYPKLEVTLLDGTGKRLDFVSSVIRELGISNAYTLHGRAEEVARLPEHREAYHFATARAVAKLPVLAAWLLPLVRPGGRAIAYKGRNVSEEVGEALSGIKQLGGEIDRIVRVGVPGTDVERNLIIINKQSRTPRPVRRGSER
jgi:16S rRNA (guanine527-N7)-methyltransferase